MNVFLSLKIVFILANSADSDELSPLAISSVEIDFLYSLILFVIPL